MNDANHERVDDFLRSLEQALGRSKRQSEGILGEVRTDLETHVKRYQAEGQSEDEAVEHALEEMGDPYELAHHMRQQIPPFQGEVLTIIRYMAAGGVICWTLLMLWYFRGGSYGLSGLVASGAVMLIHLPVILLSWPRIVWKKNWLFGLIPAGLGLLLFIFMNSAGVKNEELMSVRIRETEEEEVAALREETLKQLAEPADFGSSKIMPALIFAGLGVVAIILLVAMQQRYQRRVVVLAMLLAVVCVEVPYQVEELLFRRDRNRVRDYVELSLGENGAYPTEEVFKANGAKLISRNANIDFNEGQEGYTIFWSRPLCSGYSINCSSEDDQVWIQD